MKAIMIAAATAAHISTASAQDMTWMAADHLTLFGRLGNVQSASRQCNLLVSDSIMKDEMRRLLGSERLSADQTVDVIKTITGFSALADELLFSGLNRRQKVQRCTELLANYGPNGTTIRGILAIPAPQRR